MPNRYTLIELDVLPRLPEAKGFIAWADAENNLFVDDIGNLFGFGDPIDLYTWSDDMGNIWRDDLGNIWGFETAIVPTAENIYRVWIDASGNVFVDSRGDTTIETR